MHCVRNWNRVVLTINHWTLNIIEVPKFIEKYKAYEREGGMIDFRIFQLDTEQDDTPYQKHLAVAQ